MGPCGGLSVTRYFMAPLLRKETDSIQYTLDTPALCLYTILLSLVNYTWLLKHEYNKIWSKRLFSILRDG